MGISFCLVVSFMQFTNFPFAFTFRSSPNEISPFSIRPGKEKLSIYKLRVK